MVLLHCNLSGVNRPKLAHDCGETVQITLTMKSGEDLRDGAEDSRIARHCFESNWYRHSVSPPRLRVFACPREIFDSSKLARDEGLHHGAGSIRLWTFLRSPLM